MAKSKTQAKRFKINYIGISAIGNALEAFGATRIRMSSGHNQAVYQMPSGRMVIAGANHNKRINGTFVHEILGSIFRAGVPLPLFLAVCTDISWSTKHPFVVDIEKWLKTNRGSYDLTDQKTWRAILEMAQKEAESPADGPEIEAAVPTPDTALTPAESEAQQTVEAQPLPEYTYSVIDAIKEAFELPEEYSLFSQTSDARRAYSYVFNRLKKPSSELYKALTVVPDMIDREGRIWLSKDGRDMVGAFSLDFAETMPAKRQTGYVLRPGEMYATEAARRVGLSDQSFYGFIKQYEIVTGRTVAINWPTESTRVAAIETSWFAEIADRLKALADSGVRIRAVTVHKMFGPPSQVADAPKPEAIEEPKVDEYQGSPLPWEVSEETNTKEDETITDFLPVEAFAGQSQKLDRNTDAQQAIALDPDLPGIIMRLCKNSGTMPVLDGWQLDFKATLEAVAAQFEADRQNR